MTEDTLLSLSLPRKEASYIEVKKINEREKKLKEGKITLRLIIEASCLISAFAGALLTESKNTIAVAILIIIYLMFTVLLVKLRQVVYDLDNIGYNPWGRRRKR